MKSIKPFDPVPLKPHAVPISSASVDCLVMLSLHSPKPVHKMHHLKRKVSELPSLINRNFTSYKFW